MKRHLSPEEREDFDEALRSLEASIGSLQAQGPLSSALAAEICGAWADVYFEAPGDGETPGESLGESWKSTMVAICQQNSRCMVFVNMYLSFVLVYDI